MYISNTNSTGTMESCHTRHSENRNTFFHWQIHSSPFTFCFSWSIFNYLECSSTAVQQIFLTESMTWLRCCGDGSSAVDVYIMLNLYRVRAAKATGDFSGAHSFFTVSLSLVSSSLFSTSASCNADDEDAPPSPWLSQATGVRAERRASPLTCCTARRQCERQFKLLPDVGVVIWIACIRFSLDHT